MPKAYFILMIHNEEDAIPSVVQSIMHCDLPPQYERRILAVQDGSVDRSQALLEEAARTAPVHVLAYPTRQGMPKSFRGAFDYLEPYLQDDDLVFTMEADATNDINCVGPMVREIEKGADVVIASRYAPGAVSLGFPWWRLLGSNVINMILRLMWNVPHVTDCSVLYRV
ncbi:MAG: glycosyltransferase, partial [bacterium]|nr:glycosyltransferase [bacterium]